jgi:hypothetical protein
VKQDFTRSDLLARVAGMHHAECGAGLALRGSVLREDTGIAWLLSAYMSPDEGLRSSWPVMTAFAER